MNEILSMNGHGLYVWTSYAITLAVFVFNAWRAATAHARNLQLARDAQNEPTAAARQPTVRQIQ